jgi:hypothetical protein
MMTWVTVGTVATVWTIWTVNTAHTVFTWGTVDAHVTVWTWFTWNTWWAWWTLWTGFGLASTNAVVAFGGWKRFVADSFDNLLHSGLEFIFGDDLFFDVQTAEFNKYFFVPCASDAVFAGNLEFVLDNWDDGVDVQFFVDHRVQLSDGGGFLDWFWVIWVGVTVGDDDDNLFVAVTWSFGFLDLLNHHFQTLTQKGAFVECFQTVQFSGKVGVFEIFFNADVVVSFFGVSNNTESGVLTEFVFGIDLSGDEIDSEFHFVPSVSDAGGGIEENPVVYFAWFVFWWFAIASTLAVGWAEAGVLSPAFLELAIRCRHKAGEEK